MFGAVWLAERPGVVTAEFHGWRLDTSVGVLLIMVLVLMLAGVAGWLLWRWIAGAPGALLDGWGESRRRKGYRALTQGLAAVAVAMPPKRRRTRARPRRCCPSRRSLCCCRRRRPSSPATATAPSALSIPMLDDDQTAVLGLRGLIAQALRDGDSAAALAYAERAFALRPQTAWIVHSLFDMQAQIGRWKEAQETSIPACAARSSTPSKAAC